jgi:hypothetical protein
MVILFGVDNPSPSFPLYGEEGEGAVVLKPANKKQGDSKPTDAVKENLKRIPDPRQGQA